MGTLKIGEVVEINKQVIKTACWCPWRLTNLQINIISLKRLTNHRLFLAFLVLGPSSYSLPSNIQVLMKLLCDEAFLKRSKAVLANQTLQKWGIWVRYILAILFPFCYCQLWFSFRYPKSFHVNVYVFYYLLLFFGNFHAYMFCYFHPIS